MQPLRETRALDKLPTQMEVSPWQTTQSTLILSVSDGPIRARGDGGGFGGATIENKKEKTFAIVA